MTKSGPVKQVATAKSTIAQKQNSLTTPRAFRAKAVVCGPTAQGGIGERFEHGIDSAKP
jgi:hypothetical protein